MFHFVSYSDVFEDFVSGDGVNVTFMRLPLIALCWINSKQGSVIIACESCYKDTNMYLSLARTTRPSCSPFLLSSPRPWSGQTGKLLLMTEAKDSFQQVCIACYFLGHSSIRIFSRAVMIRAKDKLEGRDKKLLEDYCRGVDSVHDYSFWKICLRPEQSGLTGRLLWPFQLWRQKRNVWRFSSRAGLQSTLPRARTKKLTGGGKWRENGWFRGGTQMQLLLQTIPLFLIEWSLNDALRPSEKLMREQEASSPPHSLNACFCFFSCIHGEG